ncbi:hypothetical protein AGMMS49938_17120 [Fibrobacterales bacterium]|nr:hypothetical protein AGMMS49938_17120 [Fibrobacterales bacterium]
MLKKLIAASAVIALFACSSDDGDDENSSSSTNDSSSSSIEEQSSSSEEQGPIEKTISAFNGISAMFGTYPYGYTVGENKEDYWDVANCGTESTTTKPEVSCTLPSKAENAILGNELTTQYAELHYIVDGFAFKGVGAQNKAIGLVDYNLKKVAIDEEEVEQQAALGLDVGTDTGKDASALAGVTSFKYRYVGGAHEFRLSTAVDTDFWVYNVPATTDTLEIEIPLDSLVATETLAETFPTADVSKVPKFLWVVPFSAEVPANNTGSLYIDYLTAVIKE